MKAVHVKGYNVLSGASDHTIRHWDISKGNTDSSETNVSSTEYLVRVLKGHTGGVTCLQTDTDGQRMYSGSLDKTVRLWDLETGVCMTTLISTASIPVLDSVQSYQRALKRELNPRYRDTLAPEFTSTEFQGWGDTLDGPSHLL